MSATRRLRRAVDLAKRGQLRGWCPKCRFEPVGVFALAAPAVVAMCPNCLWTDKPLHRYLILQWNADDMDTIISRVLVRSIDREHAFRRVLYLNLVARGRRYQVFDVLDSAVIDLKMFDRPLTDEELDDVVQDQRDVASALVKAAAEGATA